MLIVVYDFLGKQAKEDVHFLVEKLQEIVDNRFNKEYIIPNDTKEIIKKYNLKMGDIVPKAYPCINKACA